MLCLFESKINFAPADGREPDGHDQFPWGAGEDAGDCGSASEEESEEGGGIIFTAPCLQHLWSSGLYCFWAHSLSPWLWGNKHNKLMS